MNDNFKTPTKETIDKNLISKIPKLFKLLNFIRQIFFKIIN